MERIKLISGFLWVRYDVFDNPKLSSADIMIYAALMRYMNNDTKRCFPSLSTLEQQSRLTRKTVYKSLSNLEQEGLIHITKENGKVNNYYILEPSSVNRGNFSSSTGGKKHLPLGEFSPSNNTNINKTLVATAEQSQIIAHLNKRLGLKSPKGFKDTNQQTLKLLNARLKDYTKGDIIAVIDIMCDKRIDTEWQMFLRPQTLFNVNKFEGYVNSIAIEGSEHAGVNPLKELI